MDYKTMNNKGMLARDYVIMLILFSMVAGIGGLMVVDIASPDTGYSVNISDGNFNNTYNKLSDTTALVNTASNKTTSGFGKLLGTIDIFFSSTTAIFSLIFDSFSTVNNIFIAFGTSFGIPPLISNIVFVGLLGIITTLIIFIVLSSLTKSKV